MHDQSRGRQHYELPQTCSTSGALAGSSAISVGGTHRSARERSSAKELAPPVFKKNQPKRVRRTDHLQNGEHKCGNYANGMFRNSLNTLESKSTSIYEACAWWTHRCPCRENEANWPVQLFKGRCSILILLACDVTQG